MLLSGGNGSGDRDRTAAAAAAAAALDVGDDLHHLHRGGGVGVGVVRAAGEGKEADVAEGHGSDGGHAQVHRHHAVGQSVAGEPDHPALVVVARAVRVACVK